MVGEKLMSQRKDVYIHVAVLGVMYIFASVSSVYLIVFFFSSRRRHTRFDCDWSSDVCSSDLVLAQGEEVVIASDARMPLLSRALDLAEVEPVLRRLAGWEGAAVRAIRAVRYKPGRRCLIEYDVAQPSSELVTLVGKARARGADHATFELLRELRRRGFDENAVDGICVPEPIAVVPELGLWLQCKVRGVPAMEGLAGANGLAVARRLAEAAHKLDVASEPARGEPTVQDQLRLLHEHLETLPAHLPVFVRWHANALPI